MRIFIGVLGLFLVFSCGSHSLWSERFRESRQLSPPAVQVVLPDPQHFSFAMVGDLHVGGVDTALFKKILNAAKAENDQFVVLLGDLVDQGEPESFQAVVQSLIDTGFDEKALPILGNHDIFGEGWREYQKHWGASHYSITLGNSRFLAIDSADGLIGEEQFEWLQSQLDQSKSTNEFILTHYMPVVPGQRTYLRLANQAEAERFMKLAARRQVKGVFGGHYHSYCRENISGVEYVVAGGGGGRRMEPIKENFFVQVVVDGNQIEYYLRIVS